ncbi:2-hydroxychromene-2-carboxylate isomerase [Acuticoccus sp. M5D2P5]|uniref:2-hydroxychromene-2-carboxylate isomerase n=1 Tax=Acuticoccus kalidii TaxID=2910977 RepID=UPI001F314122|nr:2-hydroxychromene-2-carboxylate isomerase [Acuticoccus kalidii]MCF3935907.1 2-hydroxychromene-2-carboxylate isomerase [Acuticoccus kalidii]
MTLTFWYDFSSTYSYLAAMRIEEKADEAGVPVEWMPFLLGPIFAEAGYDGTPNLVTPAKADYMWADIARRAHHRGLPFVKPSTFPQKSVAAARATLSLSQRERPAFSRAVFTQEFAYGRDISDFSVLEAAAKDAGLHPDTVLEGARDEGAKAALFASTDAAKSLGIFGAPTFVTTDDVLFWGDDRLMDALCWERTGSLPEGG